MLMENNTLSKHNWENVIFSLTFDFFGVNWFYSFYFIILFFFKICHFLFLHMCYDSAVPTRNRYFDWFNAFRLTNQKSCYVAQHYYTKRRTRSEFNFEPECIGIGPWCVMVTCFSYRRVQIVMLLLENRMK